MTQKERALILDLALGRVSETDFLAQFPTNPKAGPICICRQLDHALRHKDPDDVEYAMILGFRFGFVRECVGILCRLILEGWHKQHENIASALQKLKDPSSVDSLYQTIHSRFSYLDYDESYALAVKCLWALSEVNTPYSQEKLQLLTNSENKIIRENALRLLKRKQKH